MNLKIKIERFDPAKDKEPYFQQYKVEAEGTDRIVELLVRIKRYQDGSLAFRKSCAHGVCGSDAMRINGTERLACKVLVQDVIKDNPTTLTLQPLKNLPVEKDLMVSQEEFFKRFRSVKPFLINDEKPPSTEWIQEPFQRDIMDDPTKCILCESCYSACPVLSEKNQNFIGPAQIIQAYRFNEDSRDRGFESRLDVINSKDGVWSCENHFLCTKVCPRNIKITKLINLSKKKIKDSSKEKKEY